MKLADKKCVPCEGGIPPLSPALVKKYLKQLSSGWSAVGNKQIHKQFKFKDYVEVMGFVNQVALLAQAQDHHPDMLVQYAKVSIELSTHAAGGVTENDFILAAKIDQL